MSAVGRTGAIYVSGEARGAMTDQLGRAHYSYRFVEEGYEAAFRAIGLTTVQLKHPEAFSRAGDLPLAEDGSSGRLHVCIRSTENVRICRPLYNVQMFAWEFDVLRTDELHGDSPFDNQLRMLRSVDEVWTLCNYSRRVLEANGIERVRTVPSPIKFDRPPTASTDMERAEHLAELGDCPSFVFAGNSLVSAGFSINQPVEQRLAEHTALDEAARSGSLFLSILNPNDLRKNLDAMLLGFHAITARHPKAALVVKLNLPGGTQAVDALTLVMGRMPYPTSVYNERIVFMLDFLDDLELSHLYRASSFYLSAALAEGQNLPLQEAMLHGSIAVSPVHTAMLDYLDRDNAVLMESQRVRVWTGNFGASHARRPFEVDRPRAVDVARACSRALALSPSERRRLATAGADKLEGSYSVEAVGRVVAGLYDEIIARSAPAERSA